MKQISKMALAKLKEELPNGTRVSLIKMDDPYSVLEIGDKGTVAFIDDIGTIHVNWDKGSNLGIIYGEDICTKVMN